MSSRKLTVVDLFSGAGGMSYGFKAHGSFQVLAAADAEIGKPTTGAGKLQCNSTYRSNIGIEPKRLDLAKIAPKDIRKALDILDQDIDVLSVCPPCTGFSRANPNNHIHDDYRNSLVTKAAEFAVQLNPEIIVMENARELLRGNFLHHYRSFREILEDNGYNVFGRSYFLSRFGLPQQRERSIVIAAKSNRPLYTFESMWDGWQIAPEAKTVRRAITTAHSAPKADHRYPKFSSPEVLNRIKSVPHDGGSWIDLVGNKDADRLLTGAMKRIVASRKFGSYPDVYGRMAWDRPAPTIKRECAHIGNGRYAHPEADRLCTVTEMGVMNGFPFSYDFSGSNLANVYRHIGDAVPPLISYQIAHLCNWMLTNEQPGMQEIVLPQTSLRPGDFVREQT